MERCSIGVMVEFYDVASKSRSGESTPPALLTEIKEVLCLGEEIQIACPQTRGIQSNQKAVVRAIVNDSTTGTFHYLPPISTTWVSPVTTTQSLNQPFHISQPLSKC